MRNQTTKPSERAAATRDRILKAAARLCSTHGFHTTTVDAIAEEAGITKITLYKHFASKDQLLAESLARQAQEWETWLKTEVDKRAQTPEERLPALFDTLASWVSSDGFRGSPFINAAIETPHRDHPIHKELSQHRDRLRAYIQQLQPDMTASCLDRVLVLINGAIVSAQLEPGLNTPGATRRLIQLLNDCDPITLAVS